MPGDKRVRTMFLTYEAEDADADTFMIVLGSVAENFRGVQIVEFQDDTLFAEGQSAEELLHELVTATSRLTPDQQAALEAFGQAIAEWEGES